MSTTTITIGNRKFVSVMGTDTPPAGNYVAHGNKFFAVKANSAREEAYPLRVLVDTVATTNGQIVLLANGPAAQGKIVAAISGSNRLIELDATQRDSFCRSVLRLMLGASTKNIIGIGDLSDTPAEQMIATQLSLQDIKLPVVIQRAHTWRLVLAMVAAIALGLGGGAFFKARAEASVATVRTNLDSITTEMSSALSKVNEGRRTLSGAKASEEIKGGVLPMPMERNSLLEKLENYKGSTPFVIKIQNGQVL